MDRLIAIATNHGFQTDIRGGVCYVGVPWCRMMGADESMEVGVDWFPVQTAGELLRTIGY